jgi:class 3 adenylate cyclase/tetratricopeptide (TPR) repeat protein
MACPSCGAENPAGNRFCGSCGVSLALGCSACGAENPPANRFCGACGTQLGGTAPASTAADVTSPAAERRLVSVLFADLVGFTTLSESRDSEEVRELLSRYFETSRRLIELYGGAVEKFIGDAVMAVWGTPVATEDDAERAVRAALDLVAAVSALGDEVGAPDLRARAGVLTGEAAVTLGVEGQGMVAGDLVNTAARVQSVAEPGAVYVGEGTRRATEPTIVYEEAGSFELKGKEGSTPLWSARRVVSGRRGALKSQGLEAPFVGRDRELRLVKEHFHASADERRAHLVSVTGIAGIGKSRLAWEFEKYVDGLAGTTYWHRGRCLAYGEGVTYWALAEMVRMRCRIVEDDEPARATTKLEAMLSEHLLDADEREFVRPKLAHLIGLSEQGHSSERHDLFAAWRLFFERLADASPTVLVFEDLHWADASLLDFVEYLLEWSRASPLFVLTLARPELADRRPGWGSGSRNFTSLALDPLSETAMTELLDGFAPGLPGDLRDRILAHAEGVPLYAVETVRMLLDRGLLVEHGAAYRPNGVIETLDIPETLHGLIASRLDGLPAEERRLLQDASVVGKSFTKAALAAVSGLEGAVLEPLLTSLVRKEVLGVQADPTSPEHGQYGFLQDLVRRVAYETLSRRERRQRHLTTAAYLEESFGSEEEIAEVVAAHYLDAANALPDADDAAEVRAKAKAALVRAADRADSLGAHMEAGRYAERASQLVDDAAERAALCDRAAWHCVYAADLPGAERLLAEAIELFERAGDTMAAARVSGRLARVEYWQGRIEEALRRHEGAYQTLSAGPPGEDLAYAAAGLAGAYGHIGEKAKAAEMAELAIELGEQLGSAAVLGRAFGNKAHIILGARPEEAFALQARARELARGSGDSESEFNVVWNLSDLCFRRDRYEDALEHLADGLEIARRRGSRRGEWGMLAEATYPLAMLGRWEEALADRAEIPDEGVDSQTLSLLSSVLEIHIRRGELEETHRLLASFAELEESDDLSDRSFYLAGLAAVLRLEGRLQEALDAGVRAVEIGRQHEGEATQAVKQGLVEAIEAALSLGDELYAAELVDSIEAVAPGLRSPYLAAQARRFRAHLAEDDDTAETLFREAADHLRELGVVFWLAVTLREHGEWLGARGRESEAEPLRAEAQEIFAHLQATPWLARVTSTHTPSSTEASTPA